MNVKEQVIQCEIYMYFFRALCIIISDAFIDNVPKFYINMHCYSAHAHSQPGNLATWQPVVT